MKLLTAIIRPYILEEVKEAMNGLDLRGITVTEVKGYGRQKGHKELYRGSEYCVDFAPKLKLEIALENKQLEQAIVAITAAVRSGQFGDGKLFVTSLAKVMRIRTGETGKLAL